MKSIIIKNGIIGGILVSLVMAFTTFYMKQNPNREPSSFLAFLTLSIAYSFIILSILQIKKLNNGTITFGNAFLSGIYTITITSIIYVIVWLIIYYNFFPNFMEQYAEMAIKNAKPEDLHKVKNEMETYKELYKNPFFVILLTLMEILTLGIIISLISAFIFKRKSIV